MGNKYVKLCSLSLAIREIQIKMRVFFSHHWECHMLITGNEKCWQGLLDGILSGPASMENNMGTSQNIGIELPFDPDTPI